jgi:hypothetical protein
MPSDADTSVTPSIDASLRPSSTMINATNTMCQKFNMIPTPDKAALVMENVREMKSPEKAPVRRQLLGGSNVMIQSVNNKTP